MLLPFISYQAVLSGCMFEYTGFFYTYIPVALKLCDSDIAYQRLKLDTAVEILAVELPYSPFAFLKSCNFYL